MNKFFLTAIAIISLVPGITSLTIDTPTGVVQCQPSLLTWNGGTGPYFLTILPGGQVSGDPIQSFDQTDDTSKTWLVNLDAGRVITFALKDSTGQTAFSDQVTVRQGTNQGCMTAAPESTDPGASPATAASQSGTRAAVQTTAGGGTTRATNAPASRTATSGGAAASGDSNSNNANGLSVGVVELAGALGLIGAVLF